jgi:hypothetical protein
MSRLKLGLLALLLLVVGSGAEAAGIKVQMLDRGGLSQGSATVNLGVGSVSFKAALAPLPALIDTGTVQFTATIYKAYLVSSTDAAVEIPLGSVYPSTAGKASVKAALKGDVAHLGLDRVVVVAFSKDGRSSFDVLTGTIAQ